MRTFEDIAELEQAVGTHLGYSGWHIITQEQINTFAQATGDHQWIPWRHRRGRTGRRSRMAT